jgi:hypothetical protein
MRKMQKRKTLCKTTLDTSHASEERELALLAEFVRHDSVAALAGAIAGRLGEKARKADLIAEAGLGSRRRKD